MKGYLVRTDGTGERVDLVETRDYDTLRWMYRLIDCTAVDVVRVSPTLDMWVDDEGMYTKQENVTAELMVFTFWGTLHQGYYGDCLFLGGADNAGNTMGLSDQMLATLEYKLGQITKAHL